MQNLLINAMPFVNVEPVLQKTYTQDIRCPRKRCGMVQKSSVKSSNGTVSIRHRCEGCGKRIHIFNWIIVKS